MSIACITTPQAHISAQSHSDDSNAPSPSPASPRRRPGPISAMGTGRAGVTEFSMAALVHRRLVRLMNESEH